MAYGLNDRSVMSRPIIALISGEIIRKCCMVLRLCEPNPSRPLIARAFNLGRNYKISRAIEFREFMMGIVKICIEFKSEKESFLIQVGF